MFSDNSIKRILKKAGALKVSKSAIAEFKKILKENSFIIARKAVKNAQYSGRKTIKKEDFEDLQKNEKEDFEGFKI